LETIKFSLRSLSKQLSFPYKPCIHPLRLVRNKSTLRVQLPDYLRCAFSMSTVVIALATILTVVLVLAIVIISSLCIRIRGTPTGNRGPIRIFSRGFGKCFVPPSHPASQITPFGSNAQMPIFHHEPGRNMRVAHRRGDGGWEFFDSGLPSNEFLPRQPESVHSAEGGSLPFLPPTSVCTQSRPLPKVQKSKVYANCPGLVVLPPPAYSLEDSVSLNSHH